jgi:hypothetical protein
MPCERYYGTSRLSAVEPIGVVWYVLEYCRYPLWDALPQATVKGAYSYHYFPQAAIHAISRRKKEKNS